MCKRIKIQAEKIISESFPSLKRKRIRIFVLWLRFYAFSAWIPPSFRFIVISTRTAGFSEKVLTGILAHELSHQERYMNMGQSGYIRFAARYIFSKQVQEEEEKATDRLTIEKGYGKELYELTMISRNDRNHRSIIGNYLTPREIMDYAIAIGKW